MSESTKLRLVLGAGLTGMGLAVWRLRAQDTLVGALLGLAGFLLMLYLVKLLYDSANR
jgi:hypothetical protein